MKLRRQKGSKSKTKSSQAGHFEQIGVLSDMSIFVSITVCNYFLMFQKHFVEENNRKTNESLVSKHLWNAFSRPSHYISLQKQKCGREHGSQIRSDL